MLDVRYASRFRKDVKSCARRLLPLPLLQEAIDTLRIPAPLPVKNMDHPLSGPYSAYRECHIAPDWLLICRYEENTLLLYRTGSHADLFGL